MKSGTILALAGGVGGAKFANGLTQHLQPDQLTIVVNTGDDFDHLGLRVCPDLDSVVYRLTGLNDQQRGWGLASETWECMTALEQLGGEAWFRLGDRDLATHLYRSQALHRATLSEVTREITQALGAPHAIVPMSDDPVSTMVETDIGRLSFQDYFVRHQCGPRFKGIDYVGSAAAIPSPGFRTALDNPALRAIFICPSNPLLSVNPILSLPGIRDQLRARRVPVICVSPFIGGAAVKGPAAKIMGELGLSCDAAGLVAIYGDLLAEIVCDRLDRSRPEGLTLHHTDTLMPDAVAEARLAGELLARL